MEILNLISTVICDLDPMGLLAGGAPEDEYEPEIREIEERVTPELSAEEKNRISHRGAAVRQFAALFAARMGLDVINEK